MALILKNPGTNPIGELDALDSIVTTVKGGEVGTITSVSVSGSDEAAADADGDDGYVGDPKTRPVVTTNLSSGDRPLGLVDDGTTDYGTLFGSVLGANTGKSTDGAVLGPHTAAASGKLTFWTKPGTYAATLDAVDTTDFTGLVPGNTTLAVGDALYATSAGLLTPDSSSAFENVVLARFINFETNGSLVTTPANLVTAANSPVGESGGTRDDVLKQAVFEFDPPIA